ncbi:serine/threonine-protein phosphatase with EF-hands 2 isoform X1 [Strongylocentrotus purpuratus]|uniref:Serine/threonine-protein phosphatase n=2 Tax=Strongylocentrotus purpuratus TaxID=7668 RepID=A0A7M7NGM7_STRPU|nr:serine/threonine-protein phosphatase with EF-hands 2 isoform X1 [Strongylocentrotus purpuratus]
MGCGNSMHAHSEMGKSERSLKAALLIQKWYRRYQARLEARRRCTWKIFQTIEYAGEQDQLKLYNFFNSMMQTVSEDDSKSKYIIQGSNEDLQVEECVGKTRDSDEDIYSDMEVEEDYDGPHLTFPLSLDQVEKMMEDFKEQKLLHSKYVLMVLRETEKVMKTKKNINRATTAIAKQITVCGDLHGAIEDLFLVFYKNGLPSAENPYIFNGDYVDRGMHSVEIAIILFCFFLLFPNEVYLNRGNHEDYILNLRYGFLKEVQSKYGAQRSHAQKIIGQFQDLFAWLPLATLIDSKILICHGGISDKTDLTFLDNIARHKYLSVLKPPLKEGAEELTGEEEDLSLKIDLSEWRQILDILWSDPRSQDGCQPNTFRGGGSYFGPDVTKKVLAKHGIDLLIRSHECKPDGYEFTHGDKVLTVFSASNYYEEGSNRGAYIKFGTDLKPRCFQYQTSAKNTKKMTMRQKVSIVEESALRDLREKIGANTTYLRQAFQKYDPGNTGFITSTQWARTMEEILDLSIPRRTLKTKPYLSHSPRFHHINPVGQDYGGDPRPVYPLEDLED